MPLSWNEIRHNAIRFAKEAKHYTSESADKQTFWNDFFAVFGLPRKTVASFEVPVLKTSGNFGKIDLLWKGVLLVEHKSAGEDLGKAKTQAFDYIQAMAAEGRRKELPRYVIVSDFANVVLHDLEEDTRVTFPLGQLHQHIHDFAFIPGYKQHKFEEQDPINIEATEMLGELHDALEAGGYSGHNLERFLVRVLFCLFAEDTGIFEREAFKLYLENHTKEDGSDLGLHLARLFDILNREKRQDNLDEDLAAFPYVNGDLFGEHLGFADFNRDMRNALLACTRFDWSRISPAIFGSLFQSVMEPKARRQIGGHYTSERDILKVIRSLFLDELQAEFAGIKADRSNRRRARLEEFHKKLCRLRFLDPACGCGNFLVITYRELRKLELAVLQELHKGQRELTLDEINRLSQVDVDQFYGIEIGEWPARIAEVALWLMDHQMNLQVSEAFGQLYQRLPLKKSPHIHCGNALRTDWKQVLPPAQCSYVLGNPPFVGKHLMNGEQGQDMELVWGETDSAGVLDYVTGWYRKAAEYIQTTRIVVGFVSTNSISQGEQVGALWNPLFQRFGLKIHFAHRTFAWESEARGKAHVHVVIIGFAAFDTSSKRIYEYQDEKVTVSNAKNISPYLIEGSDIAISSRSKPVCNVPACEYGSKPTDNGHLIVEEDDRKQFLAENPEAKRYLRPLLCAEEYLYSIPRWCLWLVGASPADIRNIPGIRQRVEAVREFRKASKKVPTQKMAERPTVFAEIRQPTTRFMVVPQHTSETRKYVPFGYFDPEYIVHNSCSAISDATPFHFGVLSSAMHMAWAHQVCGRLESRYRYSTRLVYNNYPWPESASEKQRTAVEAAAQKVLSIRAEFLGAHASRVPVSASRRNPPSKTIPSGATPDGATGTVALPTKTATLADLYDPLATPPALQKAHEALDRAVDKCYRPEPFTSERQRVEFLFALYEKLTAPLVAAAKPKRGKKAGGLYAQPPPAPQKPLPPGRSTPESEAAAAHHHHMTGKEDSPPYQTD